MIFETYIPFLLQKVGILQRQLYAILCILQSQETLEPAKPA